MGIGRAIVAFLVALSLAMLPMAGAFAVQKPEMTASVELVEAAHDCCDGGMIPAGPAMKECQASAGCFAKCFNFFAVGLSRATLPAPISGTESVFVGNPFSPHPAIPPFRPPRA